MKRVLVGALVALALASNIWLAPALEPLKPPPARGRLGEALLGQLRTALAGELWMQVDLYEHAMQAQGIPYNHQRDVLPLLKMVIVLDPTFADAYLDAAFQIMFDTRDYARALDVVEDGLQNNPRNLQLLMARALLLSKLHRWAETLHAAQDALELSQKNADRLNCLRLMALGAEELGQRDMEIDSWRRVLSIQPEDAVARQRLKALGQAR